MQELPENYGRIRNMTGRAPAGLYSYPGIRYYRKRGIQDELLQENRHS